MIKLDPPDMSVDEVYTACISRVRNRALRQSLQNAKPIVETDSDDFEDAMENDLGHTIPRPSSVNLGVSSEEMKKVYVNRMAKIDAPGREYYDELFSSSRICALCGKQSVGSLDHCLPKADYSSLVVTPLNLVPSCNDCNKAKLNSVPTQAGDVPINPYFDDLGNEIWLEAVVIQTSPSVLNYRVVPPQTWGGVLTSRVKTHFRDLGLAKMYGDAAVDELSAIRHQLSNILASAGAIGVQDELQDRATSAEADNPNSWRSAAFRAWSSSDWFYNGGFAEV